MFKLANVKDKMLIIKSLILLVLADPCSGTEIDMREPVVVNSSPLKECGDYE